MINLTIVDYTQRKIIEHLLVTERLLEKVASKLSKSEQNAKIIAMPDLGFPRNVRRIMGGFFTGALYTWNSKIPFIPVDATINSCGVSVYKLKYTIDKKSDFFDLIKQGLIKNKNTSYDWNYNAGNHFINYGVVKKSTKIPTGAYIVMHSSASEFKSYDNGLYPVKGNWYYDKIQIYKEGDRYLRYIFGDCAEKFFDITKILKDYNKIRQRYYAGIIFGENQIENELIYTTHYGMPNINSVAMGCNYIDNDDIYLLLTSTNQSSYFIRPHQSNENTIFLGKRYTLSPHGLGMQMIDNYDFKYSDDSIIFNNKKYYENDKLSFSSDLKIRESIFDNLSPEDAITKFLIKCPGEIYGELETIYSYNSNITTN
jgi:hypothetical protein